MPTVTLHRVFSDQVVTRFYIEPLIHLSQYAEHRELFIFQFLRPGAFIPKLGGTVCPVCDILFYLVITCF